MSKRQGAPGRDYLPSVPAIQRALAVLERLSSEAIGLTLSELARELRISPSSLLAILNTLVTAQYVARDPKTRRYRLATGAQILAGAATGAPDLQREFASVADRLVAAIGETAVLWAPTGTEVVAVASREGAHELRWIPPPGLRRPAAVAAAGRVLLAQQYPVAPPMPDWTVEAEESVEEPRLLTLAVSVLGIDGRPVAALTVTGPTSRVRGPREAAAREALAAAAADLSRRLGFRAHRAGPPEIPASSRNLPTGQSAPRRPLLTGAGGLNPRELDEFLRKPWVARLACIRESGYPYVVPVWYEWDGTSFWVVSRTNTDWAACVRHNPHVSMSVDEPEPPLRRVILEGRAEFVEDTPADGQRALAARIAEHYLGDEGALYWPDQPARPHAVIRITPVKMTTWRGLISHPRYRASTRQGIA